MNAAISLAHHDPIFLRHDLMIELGRVEDAIDSVRERHVTSAPELASLQKRYIKLQEMLSQLAA